VHGYDERTEADVPKDGWRVLIWVRVRRMRCPVLDCTVQTFREQVPGVLHRYQRRISRLEAQVSAMARELAGRPSARLLPVLAPWAPGIPRCGSPEDPLPPATASRLLGIDDFALRRGLVYVTVLSDAGLLVRARSAVTPLVRPALGLALAGRRDDALARPVTHSPSRPDCAVRGSPRGLSSATAGT
jgi:hypothetical protein